MNKQAISFQSNKPSLLKYWDEKRQKLDKEEDEDFWKRICCKNYEWISYKVNNSFENWTPRYFAQRVDQYKIKEKSNDDDSLYKYNGQLFGNNHFKEIEECKAFYEYTQDMTWLQLFVKLDFEDFLNFFPLMDNFKLLYDYLHAVNGRISCLFLKIQSKRTLKSGYYWYMVILTNLTSLETLIISNPEGILGSAYKSIVKGITNF